MTQLLAKAFKEAQERPDEDQDLLAQMILDELASEAAIDDLMASRPDVLDKLAAEALAEFRAGRTLPINCDEA